ncbi:MAG: hypothetical protein ACLVKO_11690 [Dysgonomonas sp.]
MKNKIIIVFLLILFTACGEEEINNPSVARVYFKVDLSAIDNELNNIYSYKTFTKPRNAAEFVGLGGLLVYNSEFDDNGRPVLKAYDLCCPYEKNPLSTIVPNNERKAICKDCKSVYDLQNGGFKLSGPGSTNRLWSYNLAAEYPYNGIFIVRN